MDIRYAVAAMLACLAVAGCDGGAQLGGADLDPVSGELAGDDPMDGDVINEGTGDVIP